MLDVFPASRQQGGKVTRVLFDMMGNAVVVYIPGVFLHLLDIFGHHNPTPGVVMPVSSATPLPIQQAEPEWLWKSTFPEQIPSVVCLPWKSQGGSTERAFVDWTTGIVYEYTIDTNYLAHVSLQPSLHPLHLFFSRCIVLFFPHSFHHTLEENKTHYFWRQQKHSFNLHTLFWST